MNLTGERLTRLMRRHGVTIRDLASRIGVAMTRVRRCREAGCAMPWRLDWEQAIEGTFTARHRAMFRQWRLNQEVQ